MMIDSHLDNIITSNARYAYYKMSRVVLRLSILQSRARNIYREIELISSEEKKYGTSISLFLTMVVSVLGNATLYIFMSAPMQWAQP